MSPMANRSRSPIANGPTQRARLRTGRAVGWAMGLTADRVSSGAPMQRPHPLPRTLPGRLALVAIAVLLALMAYALTTYALSRELGADVAAYWGAAERIRAGEPLYVAGAANASDLYRYAPWFAYAWVPLTFLPREPVTAAWVGLMLAAVAASTLPLLRHGLAGTAAFALFAPLQLQGAVFGNVQPLLVLMLLWGVERRSGPLWIAIGASLKAVPLLLALVYAGRGEWRRAGLALLLRCARAARPPLRPVGVSHAGRPGADEPHCGRDAALRARRSGSGPPRLRTRPVPLPVAVRCGRHACRPAAGAHL